ncbi:hypothetical protein ATHL_02115 [Anaerolinea thermolimosa]|uniref:hypothetical protein n=1 Tax=Anaerolinea thermolimosa TaxID=229919 RepID=UPI0007861885|nr:hypothetical protein [Anaerolinea thermolimosa]GAP07245.1 hypothetical protein ATHL_02115 [Anaerolinea thermolimosa]
MSRSSLERWWAAIRSRPGLSLKPQRFKRIWAEVGEDWIYLFLLFLASLGLIIFLWVALGRASVNRFFLV